MPSQPKNQRFRRVRSLGSGGAGQVWLVEDTLRPGRRLALKELIDPTPDRAASLREEFATLASLRHPNLVQVDEFDLDSEGIPRFTLEFVDGRDFVAAARDEGGSTAVELAVEALRAISFLHDFGLLHRDLKPDNLLVRRDPIQGCRLVVLDFGLARQTRSASTTAHPAGTLQYMAPELLGGGAPSRRSDLFGLGAVIHEAVLGQTPYESATGDPADLIRAIQENRRAPRSVPEGMPESLVAWLDEMTAPEAESRPAGAAEALARLNQYLGADHRLDTRVTRAARLASGVPPGRERELNRIWKLVESRRSPRVVWLAGDAGTGKSRLLRWISSEAVRRGFEVAQADAHSLSEDGAGDRLAGLRRAAAQRPVVLLLDGVETASPAAVRMLESVIRKPNAEPVQIVAAVRPTEITDDRIREWIRDTDLVPTIERIDLDLFGPEQVREIAERVAGEQAVAEEHVRWLLEASEGLPLFLEALLSEGRTAGKADGNRDLEASVRTRISRVSEATRQWLQALAVLSASSLPAEISTLAGFTSAAGDQASREAEDSGLARRIGAEWSPSSSLVVSCLVDDLDEATATRLRDLAPSVVLESRKQGTDPGRMATLYASAGQLDRSVEWAERAGTGESRLGDPVAAAGWIRFALCRIPRRDRRRRALRIRHADLLIRSERPHPAARALATAARLTQDPRERTRLVAKQAFCLSVARRPNVATALSNRAASEARALGDNAALATALHARAHALQLTGDHEKSVDTLRSSLELPGLSAGTRANGLMLQAVAEMFLLRTDDAIGHYEQALDIAKTLDDPILLGRTLVGWAGAESRALNTANAERLLTEAVDHARRHHLNYLQNLALSNLANLYFETGRLDRCLSLLVEAEPLASHVGGRTAVLTCRLHRADALIQAGRNAEAVSLLTELIEGPISGFERLSLYYAEITIAEALMGMPRTSADRVEQLIAATADRAQHLPKTRLVHLVLRAEWAVHPEGSGSFEEVWKEFVRIKQEIEPLDPRLSARIELAHLNRLFRSGSVTELLDHGRHLCESAETNHLPSFAARAWGLIAEAHQNLDDLQSARAALSRGKQLLDEAAQRIDDPDLRRDFLARPAFAGLRRTIEDSSGTETDRLMAIYRMIHELNSENDPDQLLEVMLDMALEVVRAERGMVLLRERTGGDFEVRLARDLDKETLDDAAEFSRNVVLQAGAGKPVLSINAGEDERLREFKSVSMYGIRSVLCVPLRSRGRVIGAVYLDNRTDGTLFSASDLPFVEAFADNAALALENAQIRGGLQRENQRLQVAAEERVEFANMVGRSPEMQRVFDLVGKVADTRVPVMIHGESGTGKELVARAIHFQGPLKRKPFLSENCAAIPETLLESELFGHVKGAFTGAERDRAGLFEQADGGTLFLDEVGDMSPAMQARLLRVLQEGEVRRVGGNRPIHVDVRVVAATHRDLQDEVVAGRFREDLLYRLQVLMIELPPLRERPGDIPLLVDHLLRKIGDARRRKAPEIRPEVMNLFERFPWPGNVRQLESALHRLVLLAGDSPITLSTVESDDGLRGSLLADKSGADPVFSLDVHERDRIVAALDATEGNKVRAAKLLGISRSTIFRKIREYGI